MTTKYNNVYIGSVSTVVGPYEHNGPLTRRFDRYYDDMYMHEKSFENAEVHLMKESVDILLDKLNIKKKDIKHVFKPGFTTKKRGWGLGLSLAKRIVEEYHKGRIFVVNSELGKGTTFRIELRKDH